MLSLALLAQLASTASTSSTLSCALFSDLCSFISSVLHLLLFFSALLAQLASNALLAHNYHAINALSCALSTSLSSALSCALFSDLCSDISLFYCALSIIHLNTCSRTLYRYLMHSPVLSSTLPCVLISALSSALLRALCNARSLMIAL